MFGTNFIVEVNYNMSASHKIEEFTVDVLRTFSYNTVKISINYTYTGNNPKGFTNKDIDSLTEQTLQRGDVAIERLKERLSMPVTFNK